MIGMNFIKEDMPKCNSHSLFKECDFQILEFGPYFPITLSNGFDSFKINANIHKVKRLSDNHVFIADGKTKYKTNHSSFYICGFWYNAGLNTINICGKYTHRDNISENICYLNDLNETTSPTN